MGRAEEIGIRLRELRGTKTQQEVADAIGVKRETINQWESASRRIKAEHIVLLSAYFGVSADYLLGLSDEMSAGRQRTDCHVAVAPRNDNEGREAGRGGPDYEDMYAHAAAERDALAEKLAKMRINDVEEIENYKKEIAWHKRANEVLEAQLEIVRLIFGGEAHG